MVLSHASDSARDAPMPSGPPPSDGMDRPSDGPRDVDACVVTVASRDSVFAGDVLRRAGVRWLTLRPMYACAPASDGDMRDCAAACASAFASRGADRRLAERSVVPAAAALSCI